MSEKGILSKSIASNISEAIIDKLGGTGYAPTEWSKNINLLGIASEDIEEALASITEDTSSSDKGLLSLSIASDMGAILNKKYNTSRGFKPSEVSSAVSALIPLPEKTTSSSPIADFSDGADDVPTKSLVVTIPPTLSGVSSVTETQTGRNLFNYEAVEPFNNNVIITRNDGDYTLQNNNSYGVGAFRGISFHLKPASYSLSLGEAITVPVRIYKNDAWFNNGINAGNTSCTFTVTEEADYDFSCNVAANSSLTIKKCQFEVGSAATAYEPYTAPTTYTASLGRTIYGGEVDIVNGVGTDENGNDFTFTGQEIPTRLGYNAFWSDEGDTEVTYRADIDLYEAPSMLLGANNTETEGNEEQEVNE